MSKLDAALALAAEGFSVFPIAANSKFPPLLNQWPAKASSDSKTVEAYWLPVPEANIGIHCAGLVVIDVDVKKGGQQSLDYIQLNEELPATRIARTPSGGVHLFYRLPDGHPGVPNSVGALGAGLDIRSTGGYVVAAGSQTEAGEYAWVNDAPIAPAPEWLLLKLGTSVPKKGTAEPVAPAAEVTVARATDWLAQQAPAVEGQGGDARTFAVICGLRDMGVSADQARVLIEEWNGRCSPPWGPEDLDTKVANAYRYAENEPGLKAVRPEDFPTVADSTPVVGAPLAALRTLADLATDEMAGPGYVIKGLLECASYATQIGAPGQGKTFIALDQAYSVAAGLPWMGRRVKAGPVLYLAYEGVGGLKKRARALRQKYGTADVPLYLTGANYNLRDKTGREALGSLLRVLPSKPVLVVIDTFARALMGGDENSAQDVGAFNAAIAALIETTGACVLAIHHTGKDKSKGARGSSAILGAIDTEIEIDDNQVIARKQRDMEIGEAIGFKLTPVMVGVDEDGEEVTSCVVEPAKATTSKERLTGHSKRGFAVLCDRWPDNQPVDPADWKEACSDFLPASRRNGAFFDIRRTLLAKGYIVEVAQGCVQRRME